MPFLYSEGRSIRSQPRCGTPDQSPVTPISAPFSFFGTAQDQRDTKPSRAVALTLLGESVPQLLPPPLQQPSQKVQPLIVQGDRDHQSQRIPPSSSPLGLPTGRQLPLPGLEISAQHVLCTKTPVGLSPGSTQARQRDAWDSLSQGDRRRRAGEGRRQHVCFHCVPVSLNYRKLQAWEQLGLTHLMTVQEASPASH